MVASDVALIRRSGMVRRRPLRAAAVTGFEDFEASGGARDEPVGIISTRIVAV